MLGEPNRLTAAIDRVRPKVDALSADDAAALAESLSLTASDHHGYQDAQAHAHAAGKITTDEAHAIYLALGPVRATDNGGWASHVDLAAKVVYTQAIAELLGARARMNAAA